MSSARRHIKTGLKKKGRRGENKKSVHDQVKRRLPLGHLEAQSRLSHRPTPGRRQPKSLGKPMRVFSTLAPQEVLQNMEGTSLRQRTCLQEGSDLSIRNNWLYYFSWTWKSSLHLSFTDKYSHLSKDPKFYGLSIYKWNTLLHLRVPLPHNPNSCCYYFETRQREEAEEGRGRRSCRHKVGGWWHFSDALRNLGEPDQGSSQLHLLTLWTSRSREPGARWVFSRYLMNEHSSKWF